MFRTSVSNAKAAVSAFALSVVLCLVVTATAQGPPGGVTVQIPSTTTSGSYCDTSQTYTCGEFPPPAGQCAAGVVCTSASTGSGCVDAYWSWYICSGSNCTGFCKNQPTAPCWSSSYRLCN